MNKKEMVPVIARSSVLGFLVGVLPGAGATIASFLAYGTEQRIAEKEKGAEFGHGSVRGLTALIFYGIQPGPRLFVENPSVFWSVIISMYIGNVILLILNLPLIPDIARILAIPGTLLTPLIVFFSLIGVYFISFNTFDIQMMVLFSMAAVGLRLLSFPMAPMLLGFILGGTIEENLRRALLINDDSWSFLRERP
jgi:putative tricarboxylic transport membrane protein